MSQERREEEEEADSWAQTLLTVTPEDEAVLREIKSKILLSAGTNTALDLSTDSFVYRRPLTPKYLVDFNELEEKNIKHAEAQTYLQGVAVVAIPSEYKDEISQTLYMSSPCPPMKYYEDIMTSMRDGPVPQIKNTRQTQTILKINPDLNLQIATEILKIDVTKETKEEDEEEEEEEEIKDIHFIWEEEDYSSMELNTLISDILYYLEERVFWILDPSNLLRQSKIENYAQTSIKYDGITNKIIIDNETQTKLTCRPRSSNTELLSDYQANKNLINEILRDFVDKIIESLTLTQCILDKVIDKCGEVIKYPAKDQDVQTLATYKVDERKEDVLRKLQLPIVVDSLESSIVVLAIIDDLLESICDAINKNAYSVTTAILQDTVKRSACIGSKMEKIRHQSHDKLIEQILNQRREKIARLMMRKETNTVFTQTSISGVHEVTKLKESVSCICLKDTKCYACITSDKDIRTTLRTQDILLAYSNRPCQIVKMETDRRHVSTIGTSVERSTTSTTPVSDDSVSSESATTIDVVLKPKEGINLKGSLDGWARAIDTALTVPWSPQGSLSDTDKNERLTLQTMKVLQILKSTFCIRDTCPESVLEKLTKRSNAVIDNLHKDTINRSCLCSNTKKDDLAGNVEYIDNNNNNNIIIDTKTYNSSFVSDKCFCHICYTLEQALRNLPENNNSRNVKIIPIQSPR